MINEEILAGLKSALERGQSLQRAMMSLYNAGYKKEEVEEAARSLMEFNKESQLQPPIKTVPKTAGIKQVPQVLATPATVKSFPELQPAQVQVGKSLPIQKVSSYEQPKLKEKVKEKGKSGEKKIIFVLIFLLILLIGILGAIFLFRQQLIDFFSTFFS